MTISGTGKLKDKAFTLIELLFVIVIIGIIIAVSLPSFRKNFANLQLNSFTSELQSFMNYLRERSIVEQEVIYLNIDNEKGELWAELQSTQSAFKTLSIPEGIALESEKKQVIFYPDGQIDSVTINIANSAGQMSITTKGVFGGVKMLTPE